MWCVVSVCVCVGDRKLCWKCFSFTTNRDQLLLILLPVLMHNRHDDMKSSVFVPFCGFSETKQTKKTTPGYYQSGSVTNSESNCLGLLCPCPFDDLLKIDEQKSPGSVKVPSLSRHRDDEKSSTIHLLSSFRFSLMKEGMGNDQWCLILKYQRLRTLTHHLQVICVLCSFSEVWLTPDTSSSHVRHG